MALPTPDDLKTMDYAFRGEPFVDVPSQSSIDLGTMDYAFRAQPFVRNYSGGAPPPPPPPPTVDSLFFGQEW